MAGVMSFGPSQLTPPKGAANVFWPMTTAYSPSSTSSNRNVPSASVSVDAIAPPPPPASRS